MMDVETLLVVPDPVSLMESMRAVGYSVESAIADIVDNSLSADARRIDVQYDATSSPYVAVLDDGLGMEASELTDAMRHGSTNPTDARRSSDLGRFGLGLKTASLSQARKLTVVSKKNGVLSARRWDLDVVRELSAWRVVVPNESELSTLPMYRNLLEQASGTLVIWQELDRLTAGATDAGKEMTTRMAPLYEHLALVFHRFSKPEGGHPAVAISLNGLRLPARDPFLGANSHRQALEGQTISHPKGTVIVSPFILPPVSSLTPEEIDMAGGGEGLRGTQGFYVYRGRRLVIWGTWFRLVPKQEFYKLTRVQVDIPNSFDELWALDIKKSAAYPPDVIRDRLKQLIPHFAEKSKKAIQYAGRKRPGLGITPLWQRVEPSHGHYSYQVNASHPLVETLLTENSDLSREVLLLLKSLSVGLPYEAIYADMCSDRRSPLPAEELEELVRVAFALIDVTGRDIDAVLQIDPLARYPHLHHLLKERVENV
ncbi:ATP-binding protein [Stenotrophomonas sp. TWI819]|uniref:ATP-binding protein n=1 Tax=Stenotrophomonas sp. TWI819 TaxID=3136800 RepID=UPI0032082784